MGQDARRLRLFLKKKLALKREFAFDHLVRKCPLAPANLSMKQPDQVGAIDLPPHRDFVFDWSLYLAKIPLVNFVIK